VKVYTNTLYQNIWLILDPLFVLLLRWKYYSFIRTDKTACHIHIFSISCSRFYLIQPNKKGEQKMKPTNSENQVYERIEQLEARISQLEAALNNTLTFETLATRLIGNPETKKIRKPRTKKEWTPEEKAAFNAKMVAGRLAKQKASKK
jgi:hypothetical protein